MNISSGNMTNNPSVAPQPTLTGSGMSEATEAALRPSASPMASNSADSSALAANTSGRAEALSLSMIISDALRAAGLSLSDHNRTIAEALFTNNMGLSPASIKQLLSQSAAHPSASLDVLCFMNRNDLPVNTDNIRSATSFFDRAQVLMDSVSEVFSELETLADAPAGPITATQAAPIGSPASSEALPNVPGSPYAISDPVPVVAHTDMEHTPEPVMTEESSDPSGRSIRSDSLIQADGSIPSDSAVHSDNPIRSGSVQVSDYSAEPAAHAPEGDAAAHMVKDLRPDSGFVVVPEQREPDAPVTRLTDSAAPATTLHELIDSFCPETPDSHAPISVRLRSALSLKPSEIDRDSVRELYQRITDFLRSCRTIADAHPEDPALAAKTKQAIRNMEFMHDLSEVFPHIEIPIHLEDRDTTTELYVYTDGRRSRPDPRNCSAMLHLDMPALGNVDVRIRLHDQTLALDFASDDEARSFLSDNIDELSAKLTERGFAVNPSFSDNSAASQDLLNEVQKASSLSSRGSDNRVERRSQASEKKPASVDRFDVRA